MRTAVKSLGSILGLALILGACANMPTPTSQITGSYTSGLNYENFSCRKLSNELDSLARRENQLVIAQEQRVRSSQMQAFWLGFWLVLLLLPTFEEGDANASAMSTSL